MELGCGRPYLAVFLSLLGYGVVAVDLPQGRISILLLYTVNIINLLI